MSLYWRVTAVNALLFVAGTVVLAVSPATISFPIALTEVIVLVIGLAVMLVANFLLVRLALAPLDRLERVMPTIDLLRPGQRLSAEGAPEVAALVRRFNEMLERLEEERRGSGRRAIAAQEGERQRVAVELHDEVGQGLTAVLLQLKRLRERAPAELDGQVDEVREVARASLDEVRRITRSLRPGVLVDLGLARAITALAAGFAEATGVPVERRIATPLPLMSRELELAVYRIAQESLTNVARHALATQVELSLMETASGLELRIADDGIGLAVGADGEGLRGMRERALLSGGTLSIANRSPSGVVVNLCLPIAGT